LPLVLEQLLAKKPLLTSLVVQVQQPLPEAEVLELLLLEVVFVLLPEAEFLELLLLEVVFVLLPLVVLLAATAGVAAIAAVAVVEVVVAVLAAVVAEAVAISAELRPLHVALSEKYELRCYPRSLLGQFPLIELQVHEADLVAFQR
jgi:hypothetical protein